jgi:hypothetical protein
LKLESLAQAVRAEGCSWVETHPDFGYEARGQFWRCQPQAVPLPKAEAVELEALEAEYDQLRDAQMARTMQPSPRPANSTSWSRS